MMTTWHKIKLRRDKLNYEIFKCNFEANMYLLYGYLLVEKKIDKNKNIFIISDEYGNNPLYKRLYNSLISTEQNNFIKIYNDSYNSVYNIKKIISINIDDMPINYIKNFVYEIKIIHKIDIMEIS